MRGQDVIMVTCRRWIRNQKKHTNRIILIFITWSWGSRVSLMPHLTEAASSDLRIIQAHLESFPYPLLHVSTPEVAHSRNDQGQSQVSCSNWDAGWEWEKSKIRAWLLPEVSEQGRCMPPYLSISGWDTFEKTRKQRDPKFTIKCFLPIISPIELEPFFDKFPHKWPFCTIVLLR